METAVIGWQLFKSTIWIPVVCTCIVFWDCFQEHWSVLAFVRRTQNMKHQIKQKCPVSNALEPIMSSKEKDYCTGHRFNIRNGGHCESIVWCEQGNCVTYAEARQYHVTINSVLKLFMEQDMHRMWMRRWLCSDKVNNIVLLQPNWKFVFRNARVPLYIDPSFLNTGQSCPSKGSLPFRIDITKQLSRN